MVHPVLQQGQCRSAFPRPSRGDADLVRVPWTKSAFPGLSLGNVDFVPAGVPGSPEKGRPGCEDSCVFHRRLLGEEKWDQGGFSKTGGTWLHTQGRRTGRGPSLAGLSKYFCIFGSSAWAPGF